MTPPQDVERIVRGAYFEYVDLMPGNVRYWWTAIDLDKSELVAVERYPATMMRRLVELRKKEAHPELTAVRRPDADHVDWVRRHPVSREKAAEAVCLANRLWNTADAQIGYVTDAHSGLFLVDVAASRRFAGLGIPSGDAKKLEELLDSLAPGDWVAWAPLVPQPASATCPLSSFGAGKRLTCRRDACLVNKTPADIRSIRRGAYVEAVSLDLFTRLSSWVGVDLDRGEIVTVERYPASAWTGLSEVLGQQKDPKRVVLQRPDKDSVDVVRRYPVPPEKLGELVCSANALWRAGDAKMIDETTGGYIALFVVDAGTARRFDGLGVLRGEAKALGELMETLKDPEWTWYVPVN